VVASAVDAWPISSPCNPFQVWEVALELHELWCAILGLNQSPMRHWDYPVIHIVALLVSSSPYTDVASRDVVAKLRLDGTPTPRSLGGSDDEAADTQPVSGKSASLSGGPKEGRAMTDTTKPNARQVGILGSPPPNPNNPYSVEAWADRHRRDGHHPHPAPTTENPERWECKCDPDAKWTAVWRILTIDQIRQKFAHLKNQKRREPERCRYGEGTYLTHRRTP
jgi:hypothetical protein